MIYEETLSIKFILLHKLKWAISSEISKYIYYIYTFLGVIIILNKKSIKIVYKLRIAGKTIREIKKITKEKYNISLTEQEIKIIALKIVTRNIKFSDIEKSKILYLYHNYHDTDKLVVYLNKKYNYNLTYSRLKDLASRNKVKKKHQNMYSISKISRVEEYKIVDMYNEGYSSNYIAKQYGYKTRNSILNKLEKLNVKRRDCNELKIKNKSYLEFSMKKIDSKEKAYFLGLLLTDGYINKERGYIGLELTDKDVIEFLAQYIKVGYSTIFPSGKAVLNKYRINLYGRELLNSVERLGVIENKTFLTMGPILKQEEKLYLSYILRGIIDGDGWIRKDGEEFFICSASFEFMKWCKEVMITLGFIDININFVKNDYNGIYLIRTAIKYNIKILREKIYNQPLGMMRKYNRLYKKDVQRL